MEPKTTWCTARTAGSNLFYNYVGKPGKDVTLFYIIRDNPKKDRDWLSVGFVNGKPTLDGQRGGLSVDRANKGLTPDSLKNILGADYNEIMHRLKEKNEALGGQHPAREKVRDAAKSVEALKYLTVGLSAEESRQLKAMVTDEPELSPDVLRVLAGDEDKSIRLDVYKNPKTPADVLLVLANDELSRHNDALDSATSADRLRKLASDELPSVRRLVADNHSTPADVLQMLAGDENESIRAYVAMNPKTPADTLRALAGDEHSHVRRLVASNRSTPADVVQMLAKDEDMAVSSSTKRNLKRRGINEARLRRLIRGLL
jgi:hypothetical protein